MKNFRKVLALVLVVATLLSFATMASADYKDQASIDAKYELAVDVLSGFGIISGDEKGNIALTVDGKPIAGDTIPADTAPATHEVEVVVG